MRPGDATKFADELQRTGKLADPALVILSGCNIGNWFGSEDLAKPIATKAKCLVLAPGGFEKGSIVGGDATVTREYPDDDKYKMQGKTQQDFLRQRTVTVQGKESPDPNRFKAMGQARDPQSDTYYLTVPAGYKMRPWLKDFLEKKAKAAKDEPPER